ncbi:MAG: hypothetical protein LBE83_01390 [Propionibacteriaceae bacterium]|jgi:hypothetical protein|nr:hypothetical protein [Propionibacteriaceae bacterium]
MTIANHLIESAHDLLRADSARRVRLRRADAAIRTPLRSTRRIAVISLAGGVGCSGVASRLAQLLVARRGSRLLGVDAGTNADFSALTQQAADQQGLTVLRPRGLAPIVRPLDWSDQVTGRLTEFEVVITDWGHRRPAIDFEAALDTADRVVLVCQADRLSLEVAVSVATTLGEQAPCAIAAVDVTKVGPIATQVASGWTALPIWFFPYLANPRTNRPSAKYRESLITASAWLIKAASGGDPA